MINVNNLKSGYGLVEILKEPSFRVDTGMVCGLFGPNGSGKTTLLKCLSGSHPYNSGSASVQGSEISRMDAKTLSRYIAYVPQSHIPSFPFTVKEVVLMGRNPYISPISGPDSTDLNRTGEVLRTFNLQDLADRAYTELSGGQRQMVILARAFNQDTPVMLLDEPASALDFNNQLQIWRLIRSLASMGKTIIVCTHDPNHIAWFCDEVIVLKEGMVLEKGKPRRVLTKKVLSLMYGDICTVGICNGQHVIIPDISVDPKNPE